MSGQEWSKTENWPIYVMWHIIEIEILYWVWKRSNMTEKSNLDNSFFWNQSRLWKVRYEKQIIFTFDLFQFIYIEETPHKSYTCDFGVHHCRVRQWIIVYDDRWAYHLKYSNLYTNTKLERRCSFWEWFTVRVLGIT